jgi:ferredoxin/flavodoxin---NADP+ reductase
MSGPDVAADAPTGHSDMVLRIAVVGSGPAGIYAAEALTRTGRASVDVIDALPAPYGLVRYGVAPDHPKIRSIIATLHTVLEHPDVRFLGNIHVGTDLTTFDMTQHYDAVLVCTGAALDRRMGIPGEDLPGSVSATDFVAWYNGHPDTAIDRFTLDAARAVVVGAGNVALDVARILAKPADELNRTDLPDHVLDTLRRSRIRDITMVARRGPVQAKFTTKELRELGEIAEADVVVESRDLELDEVSRQMLASSQVARRNLETVRQWADRTQEGRYRRLEIAFWWRPVQVLGADRVTGLLVERTRLDESGNALGTGEMRQIEADLVLRSIGYRGSAFPGLPFDERAGVVPNDDGRVLDGGEPLRGWYVAGWIKRGPTGVIGTNRRDAHQTVDSLLEDAPSLPVAPIRDPDALTAVLAQRGVTVVTWDGWHAIDVAEVELGRGQGRDRARIVEREQLLQAARALRDAN